MKTVIKTVQDVDYIFNLLGIKDITTDRQRKNGTQVYELPIKKMYSTGSEHSLVFACYETGYVRNLSHHLASCYQINKTKQVKRDVPWSDTPYTVNERILIPNKEDRLIYLCNYILKNYYHRPLFTMCNYNKERLQEVSKEYHQMRWGQNSVTIPRDEYAALQKANPLASTNREVEVQVIVDGTRYRIQ
tara:strand:- start:420 stop:986 length:567 start_codon:yes stop_codon:yes gene_type:complete